MAWWEVDFNYGLIRMLALLGLAKDIKLTRTRAARNANGGDPKVSV
jgi:fatty-acid desaturase